MERDTMRTVIIAPHPDDEWIGCGCTLLDKIDKGEKVKVLLITKLQKQVRVKISQRLAQSYKYDLKILWEPEQNINSKNLERFLKKEIRPDDVVYVPDYDGHMDHKSCVNACKKVLRENKLIQYCVYNQSLNPFIRVRNKIKALIFRRGFPSFRQGIAEKKFSYKLAIKNEHVKKFNEMPRDADVFRVIK